MGRGPQDYRSPAQDYRSLGRPALVSHASPLEQMSPRTALAPAPPPPPTTAAASMPRLPADLAAPANAGRKFD